MGRRSRAGWRARLLHLAAAVLVAFLVAGGFLEASFQMRRIYERAALRGALESTSSPARGVVQVEPWLAGCEGGCSGGYLDFLQRHQGERPGISRSQLAKLLDSTDALGEAAVEPLAATALSQRIRSALVVEDLLAQIDEHPLLVAKLAEREHYAYVEQKLLFGNPEVGSFEAIVLLPRQKEGRSRLPAVLGLHGHRDTAETFVDENLGRDLAVRGFVVLMPTIRAHDCSVRETRISRRFLLGERTLLGLKVYETVLMARYLQSLTAVDASRIGILGHSGGSYLADLAVRISDDFAAKVIDLKVYYRDYCGILGVHCQTVPALFPLSREIAFEGNLTIPTLKVPYKFQAPAVRDQILRFFERTLGSAEEDISTAP